MNFKTPECREHTSKGGTQELKKKKNEKDRNGHGDQTRKVLGNSRPYLTEKVRGMVGT